MKTAILGVAMLLLLASSVNATPAPPYRADISGLPTETLRIELPAGHVAVFTATPLGNKLEAVPLSTVVDNHGTGEAAGCTGLAADVPLFSWARTGSPDDCSPGLYEAHSTSITTVTLVYGGGTFAFADALDLNTGAYWTVACQGEAGILGPRGVGCTVAGSFGGHSLWDAWNYSQGGALLYRSSYAA